MSSENQTTKSNKIQLSLAAIMFFAPLIKRMLKNSHLELNQADEAFIEGYIKFGYLSIGGLLLAIGSGISLYLTKLPTLDRIYMISSTLLIIILIMGVVGILGDIAIFQKNRGFIHTEEIQTDKGNIFLSYLPFYNVFLWYKIHDFTKPYWWLKESLLMRTLFFVVITITQSPILGGFIMMFIVIRIASLLSGVDFVDNTIKTKLNTLFTKNPEELWGYVSGTLLYIRNNISDKNHSIAINTYINTQKDVYKSLNLLKSNKNIIVEYSILGAILLVFIYQIWNTHFSWIPISIAILLIGRYGIMILKWKHTTHIPVLKEIVVATTGLYKKLFHKNESPGSK